MKHPKYTLFTLSDRSRMSYIDVIEYIVKRLKIKIKDYSLIDDERLSGKQMCGISPRLSVTEIDRIVKVFKQHIHFL